MIEILAGTPPGGGQDRAARALVAALEAIGETVVVTNLPGRGGSNAWERIAGVTSADLVAVTSPTLVTNGLTGASAVRASADLTHLALLCAEALAFVTSGTLDASGVLARLGDPGSLRVAIATAPRNLNHLAIAVLCRAVGADPRSVSVRAHPSARDAVAEVVAATAELAVVSAASALPEHTAGAARIVALSSPSRLSAPLDEVPIWLELGVGCDLTTWRGLAAGPDLPAPDVAAWDRRIRSAVETEPWRAAVAANLWVDDVFDSAAASRFVSAQESVLAAALADLAG